MEQWRHRIEGQEGFTLIEVLAACVILAVVAVPLVQMLWVGNLVGYKASQKTIAVNIAQGKMEELLAQGYAGQKDIGAFETGRSGFAGTICLAPWEDLRLVTVRVDYCPEGEEQSTELYCILPLKE